MHFREQFESRTFRAKPSGERGRPSHGKEKRSSLNDKIQYDVRPRSGSVKLNENADVAIKADKFSSKFGEHQQSREKFEENEDNQMEIRNNIRTDRKSEYPLRSLMERNKIVHSDKSHAPQFQLVCKIFK